jgi:predicted Kef-type K+ transport protein
VVNYLASFGIIAIKISPLRGFGVAGILRYKNYHPFGISCLVINYCHSFGIIAIKISPLRGFGVAGILCYKNFTPSGLFVW